MAELSPADPESEGTIESVQSWRGQRPEEQLLYDRLIDAIIDKTLRPGQHLNEAKLAASYNVPRSRVRRVLERLRDEAVVELQLNRGAFISRPTVAEARDLFEARKHLESVIVRLACERATSADIARLREHLALEADTFDHLRPGMNRVAGDFHVLLAEVAGNSVFLRTITLIIRRFGLIQSLYEKRSGVLCLVDEHKNLVDRIEARDVEGAVAETLHHIQHIEASLDITEQRRSEIDIYELP
jgi:DNA-binding GntR family transcriptional regulator